MATTRTSVTTTVTPSVSANTVGCIRSDNTYYPGGGAASTLAVIANGGATPTAITWFKITASSFPGYVSRTNNTAITITANVASDNQSGGASALKWSYSINEFPPPTDGTTANTLFTEWVSNYQDIAFDNPRATGAITITPNADASSEEGSFYSVFDNMMDGTYPSFVFPIIANNSNASVVFNDSFTFTLRYTADVTTELHAFSVDLQRKPTVASVGTDSSKATIIWSGYMTGHIIYQIRRADLTGDVISLHSDRTYSSSNIIALNSEQLSIILSSRTKFQTRVHNNSTGWTNWIDFKTRAYKYSEIDSIRSLSDNNRYSGKYSMPRIVVTNNSSSVETVTNNGVRIVNSDTGFAGVSSITKTPRGYTIDNS